MSEYTYGVQAIIPLIGNNEDVARFDVAMTVSENDVLSKEINRKHEDPGRQRYTAEACHTLIRWVWSRRPENVIWRSGTEQAVYKAAIDLGSRYVPSPPLVQSANIRVKIARIAAALAARTYSTDRGGQHVIVTKAHVEDAVRLLDRIYGLKGFGYKDLSAEAVSDAREARENYDAAKRYLVQHSGLAKFLRSVGGNFRRQDMEDMMNLSREETNGIINSLYKMRMVRRDGPQVKAEGQLQSLLREVRE
jgi:hypothetical protein